MISENTKFYPMTHKPKYDDFLAPGTMIQLYSQGAFPMGEEDGSVNWYMPQIRSIIPLDKFNIPSSLKTFMKNTDFEYRFDMCTMEVVKKCSQREKTWINDALLKAYEKIHALGYLHSVEVFQKSKLVGGLYGVAVNGAFFGESMFSEVSQASKCALVKLVERLNEKGFTLLDIQFTTKHLKMFGAVEITFDEYYDMLLEAYYNNAKF